MNIKKKADSFNQYTCDFSYGELCAMVDSLEKDHAGAIADELFAGLKWYLEKLPKPGTEEDEKTGANLNAELPDPEDHEGYDEGNLEPSEAEQRGADERVGDETEGAPAEDLPEPE